MIGDTYIKLYYLITIVGYMDYSMFSGVENVPAIKCFIIFLIKLGIIVCSSNWNLTGATCTLRL